MSNNLGISSMDLAYTHEDVLDSRRFTWNMHVLISILLYKCLSVRHKMAPECGITFSEDFQEPQNDSSQEFFVSHNLQEGTTKNKHPPTPVSDSDRRYRSACLRIPRGFFFFFFDSDGTFCVTLTCTTRTTSSIRLFLPFSSLCSCGYWSKRCR